MTQRTPLVALTASTDARHGRKAIFLYTSYIAALEYAGLAAVLVTPEHSAASVRAILSAVDGLVLSGGEDVDPIHYGEEARVELDCVYPERDAMEFEALRCALERDIPVLGICRGQQVLNVALGGTLIQDIPTEVPGALGHSQDGGWDRRAHDVFVEPDSLLCRITGSRKLHINSFHHQAVREPAPGLRVTARSEDGIIEAVESESYRWLLGVQWHPERLEASESDRDPDRLLFDAFGAAVRDEAAAALP
jgi:gamma-glutamyl-gamma-aminobutyrate hydrolase PuuD